MPIKISFQNKALSAVGGLLCFEALIKQMRLGEAVEPSLPTGKISGKSTPFDKFQALLLASVAGAECLDDMDRLQNEPVFGELNGPLQTARSYGNFLRKFSSSHLQGLNHQLSQLAGRLRSRVGTEERLILDMDSTGHIQHGEKMEGLAFNYKNEWGLDSIEVFDQLGFLYYVNVRSGSTFTADDAPFIVSEVARNLAPSLRRLKPLLRCDSGYCNNLVFEACEQQNLDLLVAMRENFYAPLLKRRIKWRLAKSKELAEEGAEMGESLYFSKRCAKLYRVVFIRRPRKGQRELFADWQWTYQAYITSISSSEMDGEEIVKLYRQRGNAENYIRELKNGYDLHHFPCQKLNANRAYALIAGFAYNLMRGMALMIDPKKPPFAKRLRFLLVNLACQVVRKARETIFIFPHRHQKEVNRCLMNIRLRLGYG